MSADLNLRIRATDYDRLRYQVPSSTVGKPPYLVELDAYEGNGGCSCKDFGCNLEPILKRGISPKIALECNLISLRYGKRAADGLRCKHILEARAQFVDDVLAEIKRKAELYAQTKNSPQARRSA